MDEGMVQLGCQTLASESRMSQPTLADRLRCRERPAGRTPVMFQRWSNLLFLHWTMDPAAVQRRLPPGLTVDTWEGQAYVGLVPFFMERIRPRGLVALPWLSYFLETNVRTYVVDANGMPGVWFLSLDANNPIAVQLGRWWFQLPYHHATISARWDRSTQQMRYRTKRHGLDGTDRFTYTRVGPTFTAEPGTLEFFLAERYVLFAASGSRLLPGWVAHRPYPLQRVEGAWTAACGQHLLAANGLPVGTQPPSHALATPGVDVEVFALGPA